MENDMKTARNYRIRLADQRRCMQASVFYNPKR